MDKDRWLRALAAFLVEGHKRCWAGDGAEETPMFPGMKCLYHKSHEWEYRDSYSGYFRAPGSTFISFRDVPVWNMSYFGQGQMPGQEPFAKPTYAFLKRALLQATPALPYRGPSEYREDGWTYRFQMLHGDLEDFLAKENVFKGNASVFSQTIGGGIIIGRDQDRNPVRPWEL